MWKPIKTTTKSLRPPPRGPTQLPLKWSSKIRGGGQDNERDRGTLEAPSRICVRYHQKQQVNNRRDKRTTGKDQTKEFYVHQEIMNPTTFDSVNWEDLQDILAIKPKIYQLWFGKQCSGYCGTWEMLRRWDKTASSSCLNCGVWKENADHLNRCPNKDRQLMPIKCTKILKDGWPTTTPTPN